MRTLHCLSLLVLITTLLLTGCGPAAPGETGTEIVEADEVAALLAEGAILVDAQGGLDYNKSHIEGAIGISRADIVVNEPYPNMLAPKAQIEKVFSSRGIGNDTAVVIYDNNKNMDAARLWWTFKYYGHDAVKVVSGGFTALQKAGFPVSTEKPQVAASEFSATEERTAMIADRNEIKKIVDEDPESAVLIDTRSLEEYNEGTIPGSVLLDYSGNNFPDDTYKPVRQIRIRYLEEGIGYDDTVYMYCKTSIRGAQTYLALYNAGYRDLKLYDGAWVEWSANPMNPVYKPEVASFQLDTADNS
jgi:thiosulfate/3-mercaptopyruvate sulfurtransferase